MAAGTENAAHGDTALVMTAALDFHLGDQADGRRLYIANVDATVNQVTVEVQGSTEGIRRYNLTGKGDYIYIPAGDINLVRVSAQAYPTTIAFAYLSPHMDIGSGQKR